MTSADAPAAPSEPGGSADFISSPAVGPGGAFSAAEGASSAARDNAPMSGSSSGSSSAKSSPVTPAASSGAAAFTSSPDRDSSDTATSAGGVDNGGEPSAANGSAGGYTFAEADARAAAAGDAAEAPGAADAAVDAASQMELVSPPVGVEEAAAGAAWGSGAVTSVADGSGASDESVLEALTMGNVPEANEIEAAAAAAVSQLQLDAAGAPKLPDASESTRNGDPVATPAPGGSAGGAARSGATAEAADTALLNRKRKQASNLRAKLRRTEAKAAGGDSKAQKSVVPQQEQVGPHTPVGGMWFTKPMSPCNVTLLILFSAYF